MPCWCAGGRRCGRRSPPTACSTACNCWSSSRSRCACSGGGRREQARPLRWWSICCPHCSGSSSVRLPPRDPSMGQEQSFHLSIGSRFENIELVQVVLKDCLERLGMDEDARHWIDIAVREAVANAIKHGNAQDPAKQVHVDVELDRENLVI